MSLDLQPLTKDNVEATLPTDSIPSDGLMNLGSMNLCFRNDEESTIVDQLVIYDISFGPASSDDKIKVKPLGDDEIIEVNKNEIKV